jgi:3-deoxy-D-manno-octulosonic-acid transferase
LFGTNVAVRYLPYDFPWAARRFLRLQRPRLGVLMETEIWPELISACKMFSVPVYLVNARLSARSAKGYARLRALAGDTLKKFSGIAAQYEEDAERLRALGAANVRVSGNLKFDFEPDTAQVADGRAWHAAWGADRPVLLAASTREGEEALILDAVARYANASWLLVLVPRHPQRFDEVAALIVKHGLKFQRKSASNEVPSDVRVLLGDSMGEMTRYYACCDAAFIGGSLLPFGGQNLIEAAACGVPVLVGNHTFNFERIADMALACGAARRVGDAHALVLAAKELMDDKAARESMSRNALEFARRNRGAVKKVLALLADSPALDQRLR